MSEFPYRFVAMNLACANIMTLDLSGNIKEVTDQIQANILYPDDTDDKIYYEDNFWD